MITMMVAGNVGKDAELRKAGDQDVLSFSIASDHPKKEGETIWVDVSVWGKRGVALEKHIRKGDKVTVVGRFLPREHEGKTYFAVDTYDVALQGSSGGGGKRKDDRDDRDAGRREERKDDRRDDPRRDDRDRDDRRGNDRGGRSALPY